MKHGIIFGAHGIVGNLLSEKLLLKGDWKVTGVTLSKSQEDSAIDLIICDLLDRKQCENNIGTKVKDVTHFFFAAWKEGGKDEVEINLTMLKNALDIVVQHSSKLEYVYLQTGTKYYGMHLGPEKGFKTPSKENFKRLNEPIFYYPQEDYVQEVCNKKGIAWGIARPPTIVGFTRSTAMNLGVSLGVYASILKELGKPLLFPYGEKSYKAITEVVDNKLVCDFILWQLSHDHAKNQIFNVTNGDIFRKELFWNCIAEYFGMKAEMSDKEIDLVKFMEDNKGTWKNITQKHNLEKNPIENLVTPKFMKVVMQATYDCISDTSKVRSYGFNQFKETDQMFTEFFDSLKLKKIIPY